MINPIATLLTQMGHAFIDPAAFTSAVDERPRGAAGDSSRSRSFPAMFALGWWVFTREAPRVAENL